ncbi:MAG: hypothetical protein GY870_00120, partial [archaeon]|nr:hypothetical protein [archaeon]
MKYDLNGLNAEKFKLPPKMYQPMVRWWWPGLDVIKEELIREVKELDEMNIYGAEIQSFMIGVPTNLEKKDRERAERSHRYMQPYYFEMLKAVLDEAKRRDMIVDITENSAWPAGGVDITKELSMKMLLFGQKVIKGGIHYSGKIPKFKKLLFYRILSSIAHIVEAISPNLGQLLSHTIFSTVYPKEEDTTLKAVVAVKPIGKPGKIHVVRKKTHLIDFSSSINITDKVNENGIIEWDVPEGKWQIFAFYQGPSNIEPLFDTKSSVEGKSLVMGHFSSKPIIHHLENHFGEQNGGKKYFAEHYGNTFRAFFTDSLELSADWHFTDDFIEKFRKYRGYDITPYLPVCYTPKKDNKYILVMLGMGVPCFDFKDEDGNSIGDRIRWDYDKTLSDLFC